MYQQFYKYSPPYLLSTLFGFILIFIDLKRERFEKRPVLFMFGLFFFNYIIGVICIQLTMGVPVFFRWLCSRNPKIIRDVIEPEQTAFDSGNPHVDHFYIDMNGLIHPSCNPKGQNIKIPTNFQEQCENIYEYIDKLINIVRPKKTLYLAIDGVAPRAKMNQQRSRRFRAAMESERNTEKKHEILENFKKIGMWTQEVENYAYKKSFDSNVITPGTEFLSSVCVRLREYIKKRLESHKLWKNLVVIFSDANNPGEGQHKIMDFIRQERASENYSPYQSHCIYGADADLIMLSLATHEPKFYIIREIVITAKDKFCTNCQKKGHFFMDCQRATSIEDEMRVQRQYNAASINVQFQFIRVQMVREFIHINFKDCIIPFGYNLERIIDDFVFLCFFVGNDFLPHIPCLSIRDGGIDALLRVYQHCLSFLPDYITNQGHLNFKSLKLFIQEISKFEEDLVGEMMQRENYAKDRQMSAKRAQERQKQKQEKEGAKFKNKNTEQDDDIDPRDPMGSFISVYKKMTREEPINLDDYSVFGHSTYSYKEKYYTEKFRITPAEFPELRHNISKSYIEALQWICGYYYQGVQSWEWFYPFHYSPFFTDIMVPEEKPFQFNKGTPFKPFQQLMAVLPPRTCEALPRFMRWYMQSIESPIIDFFPSNFEIDLVGKKFAWLGQVILPFMDEKRMLDAMTGYEEKLTDEERERNRFGITNIYINRFGTLGRKINDHKVGDSFKLAYSEKHGLEGDVTILEEQGETISYCFQQPLDRRHEISLKEGNQFDPLAEIDEQFISRTDRRAFSGERTIRLIERCIGMVRNQNQKQRYIDRRRNEEADQEDKDQNRRERSREKYRSYNNSRSNQ